MSFNAVFYNFSKRKNSTAQPTGTGQTVPILLKDECDAEFPILEIMSSDPDNYYAYNYVYLPFFQRYYFVRKRSVDTGKRLFVELEEDYLGTAKNDIVSITNAFIEYSSMITNNVVDSRIPQTVVPTYTRTDANLSNTTFTASGCIILGVTGARHNGLYILGNSADIYTLFTDIDWSSVSISVGSDDKETIKNVGDGIVSTFQQFFTKGSASANLRSALMFPWVVHSGAIGAETTDLIIGAYPTGKRAYKVRNEIIEDHVLITIPWINNNWKRSAKYTELILYMPLFGLVRLPVDELIDDTRIRVTYTFSYNNGDIAYQIEGMTSNHIVSVGKTNVAAPLAIGSSNINVGENTTAISAFLSGMGKAIGGVADVLGAENLASGLSFGNDMSSMANGGFGGFACAELDTTFHLYQFSHNLTESPANMASVFGYPRGNVGSLSGLTGYTKLRNYTFGGNYTLAENEKITNYLNNGFYIE